MKHCDCDRPVTAEVINSTDFPRDKRLAEVEAKLAGDYVGGMTEFWQRQKAFLLSEKGQEIADVLDGPEQECYPIECSKECRCEICRYCGA